MKKSLDHLSEYKQQEIKYIVEQIQRICDPEFIILYGSYARGDHVEHDVTLVEGMGYREEFKSDIDILIVLKDPQAVQKYHSKLHHLQSRFIEETAKYKIKSPVSLLFDDLVNINVMLAEANPFFKDIMEEGIELYSSGRSKLSKAYKQGPLDKRNTAQKYFDLWFYKAKRKYVDFLLLRALILFNQAYSNDAAFHLHQASEACFRCILHVFTFYAPKSHDIERLLKSITKFHAEPSKLFPQDTAEEKRLFELLKSSYVDARYSPVFQITRGELKQIAKKVKKLIRLVKEICNQRIESYQ